MKLINYDSENWSKTSGWKVLWNWYFAEAADLLKKSVPIISYLLIPTSHTLLIFSPSGIKLCQLLFHIVKDFHWVSLFVSLNPVSTAYWGGNRNITTHASSPLRYNSFVTISTLLFPNRHICHSTPRYLDPLITSHLLPHPFPSPLSSPFSSLEEESQPKMLYVYFPA